ncbi:MAG: hypothetical protein E7632_06485 [Ruminococcaceae bacterium]|nr:hypothetical protein [Oscillospiraceae bacterium]
MKKRIKGLLSLWLAIAILICGTLPVAALTHGIQLWHYYDRGAALPGTTLSESECLAMDYGATNTVTSLWTFQDPDGKALIGFNVYDCTYLGGTITLNGSPTFYNKDSTPTGNDLYDVYGEDAFIEPVYEYKNYRILQYRNDGSNLTFRDYSNYTIVSTDTLDAPTRDGYTFLGWSTDESGSAVFNSNTTAAVVIEDIIQSNSTADGITLYAIWKKNPTVTFNYNAAGDTTLVKNDGNPGYTNDQTTVEYKGTVTLPQPTRNGYTFDGWDGIYSGSPFYSAGTTTSDMIKLDTTMVAQWTANTNTAYNVEFYYDGVKDDTKTDTRYGTTGSGVGATSGDVVPPAHFTFDSTNSVTFATLAASGTVLKLYFTPITYKINYDANGTGITVPTPTQYTYDSTLTLTDPTVPTGYTFSHWSLYQSGMAATEQEIKDACANSQNNEITLYACVTPNSNTAYTIQYIKVTDSGEITETESKTGTTGDAVSIDTTSPDILNKYPHYNWESRSGEVLSDNIAADGSTELVIYYTPITYTINFHSDDPTQTMTSLTFDVTDANLKLPACTFTKTDYRFAGWAVGGTSGVVVTDESSATDLLSFASNNAIDLTATWSQIINHTVTFHVVENTITVAVEDGQLLTGAPTVTAPEGYTFDGWKLLDGTIFDPATTPITGDVHLYAVFTEIPEEEPSLFMFFWLLYKVDFIENGGSYVKNTITNVDCTVDKPEDPTRDGYNFAGWYTDEELTNLYDFDTVNEDRMGFELYAKWIEIAE